MSFTPSASLRLPDAPTQSDRDKLTIFISIVCYRDPETLPTLTSLLTTATNPTRLHIGIVWQYHTTADTHLFHPPPAPTSPFFPSSPLPSAAGRMRQLLLGSWEARGPMYARALAETLYDGETFYMQIDSHMRFVRGWDAQLINTVYHAAGETRDARVVLTGYPADYDAGSAAEEAKEELEKDERVNIMTATHFGNDGMLRLKGVPLSSAAHHHQPPPLAHFTTHPPPTPLPPLVPAYFLAAGFLFTTSAYPTLLSPTPLSFPGLFFGEEALLSVRCFTAGFRCYHTLRPVVRHCWSRGYRPSWRVDRAEGEGGEEGVREIEQEGERSRERVRQLLEGGQDVEGLLGSERRVKEYWEWVGVDWQNKVVSERAQRGGVDETLLDRRKQPSSSAAGANAVGLNDDLLQRIMAFTQALKT